MVLFDALSRPFRGLRTYPQSSAIAPGYWKEAKNIRVDTGAISLRSGQTLVVDASSLSATSCVGSHLIVYGLYAYYYVALNFSGTVRIYVNQYTISTATWGGFVECTTTSTRMALATTGLFSFTTTSSSYTSEPITIVQNGVDTPRVIKGVESAIANQIEPPTEVSSYKPVFGFASNLDITAASTATNSDGAKFAASTTGSRAHWLWTFTTPTAADTAQLVKDSGTITLADSKQLLVLMEASSEDLIDGCKWELVTSSGGPYTIHDPANDLNTLVSVETDIPGVRLYGFSIEEHAGNLTQVRGIKLTLQNAGVTAGGTIAIYGIHGSGRVPGFAQYGLAYFSNGSQCESPGVVYDSPSQAVSLSGVWGDGVFPAAPSAISQKKFRYPLSEEIYYQVSLPTIRMSSAQRDLGVDFVDIYRRDPGETEFIKLTSIQAATFSGSWSYTASYSAARYNFVDTVESADRDDRFVLPDAFNESIPIGSVGIATTNRHYVGTNKVSGRPFNTIKASDYGYTFRFRSIPNLDEISSTGYATELDRDEVVTGFQASSSSILGSAQVYCYTNKGTYAIQDPLVRRVSSVGCIASRSISESQGRMFWFDQSRSIRRSDGTISNISRLRIDDLLNAATNTDKITSAFFKDRYYFGYSGGILVWSELLGDWESLDIPGVSLVNFHNWGAANANKLYFSSSNGSLYEYESGTLDVSSQILISLQTPDLHGENWERVEAGQTKVVSSDKNSETMTVLYTAQKPAATDTGTIDLDAGGSETTLWRQDKRSTGGDTGIAGCSVNIKLSATVEGPFVIQAITSQIKGVRGIGQDA